MSETLPTETGPVAVVIPSRARRLLGPVAGIVAGLALLALTLTVKEPLIPTGMSPRWWPQMLGLLLTLLSLGVAVKEFIAPSAADPDLQPPTRTGIIRVAAFLAIIAVYGVLWYFIAFPVATFALFAAMVWVLGERGWKALLLFPAITTGVLYVLFGLLLKVPL
ncbi:tripartite tricarboxylate transporter TctB family protein [Mycetocola tolaasinivorans]|uniref:Tripartite tricarboxylate transporter TctB family protein n=1 Tax=Mycetocola tolaasinivorans TaxID=76635 RepID=A0A3L7AA52_9MICO|nr:tripartite tricarboxylate transporter TctB family protein [Mycetocola tolaasinivorans]RLP77249.1 tripartite tricarboxylate transporter TctB family protein [Mycetocola tolaasinivorans]